MSRSLRVYGVIMLLAGLSLALSACGGGGSGGKSGGANPLVLLDMSVAGYDGDTGDYVL